METWHEARENLIATAEHVSRRPGWLVEHVSESGSVYAIYAESGDVIRMSDHYVPATIERQSDNRQPWVFDLVSRSGDLRRQFDEKALIIETDYQDSKN